uniref:Putative secreted protein n=1 Tax=Ixodes ricinus TaxID=34613 RepID=V5HFL3_IXORI
MIVTGIFLLFAAVPLVCVAEENAANRPSACMQVSESTFKQVGCLETLSTFLGSLCSTIFSKEIQGGTWLGYAGSGDNKCKVCCVNSKDNVRYYNVTNAPPTFPCGHGKKCKRGTCPS